MNLLKWNDPSRNIGGTPVLGAGFLFKGGRYIRLQTYLAKRGICSRRSGEILIKEGRVSVNGRTIHHMGFQVNPDQDVVEVDGRKVPPEEKPVAIAFHKPRGVVSTCRTSKEKGPAITDYIDLPYRLYPAGRLDRDSSGLMIVTNNGNLALRITHPRYRKEKEYEVQLKSHLSHQILTKLQKGIELPDGPIRPKKIWILPDGTVGIIISEGRKRIIRRMFEAVGNQVVNLHRIRIGEILVGNLTPGAWRYLSDVELESFQMDINP